MDGGANIFQGPPDSKGPQERGPLPHFYHAVFTDIGVFFEVLSELTTIHIRSNYANAVTKNIKVLTSKMDMTQRRIMNRLRIKCFSLES